VGSAPQTEGASPTSQVVVRSAFEPRKTVDIDLTYRFVSGLRTYNIPAYSTGDVRIGWRLWRDLVGRNLFQPWHPEFASETGPPVGFKRSYYIRIAWTR